MPSVSVTPEGLQVEAGDTPMSVHTADWEPAVDGPSLPRPVDAAVSGHTACLRFPPGRVRVERLDEEGTFDLGESDSETVGSGEYLVVVDTPLVTEVRFAGPAALSTARDDVTLSFPAPRRVTVGFRSASAKPAATVVVPETAEGMAIALSCFGRSHRTATPDRSFPAMRRYPPRVEFGETVDVPEGAAVADGDEVALRLPADRTYPFTAASLAYYLGAEVSVEADRHVPVLETPTTTVEYRTLPAFQYEVAADLRRTFLLDALVRGTGPNGVPVAESEALDDLDLDAGRLYDASPGERFESYRETDFGTVSDRLPEWPLSLYVKPTAAHFRTLPHLLREVPNLFVPTTEPLDSEERLDHSLGDDYRGPSENAPDVDLVEAHLGPGSVHGWLADGVPVNAFKTIPEAYEHRTAATERAEEPLDVVVVNNEPEMAPDMESVRSAYHEWSMQELTLSVEEECTVAELAEIFESDNDFVHFVGHCEVAGLRCRDGTLSTTSLSTVGTRTFFLNACGSYHEGLELVRRGSVAGGITFDTVLDGPATRVGRTFVRLFLAGFDLHRGLELARRQVVMSQDYAVVGDGTYPLRGSSGRLPGLARVEARGDEFHLEYVVSSLRAVGGQYRSLLDVDGTPRLLGSGSETTLERAELLAFLDRHRGPVVYEGDIRSSADMRDHLTADET